MKNKLIEARAIIACGQSDGLMVKKAEEILLLNDLLESNISLDSLSTKSEGKKPVLAVSR